MAALQRLLDTVQRRMIAARVTRGAIVGVGLGVATYVVIRVAGLVVEGLSTTHAMSAALGVAGVSVANALRHRPGRAAVARHIDARLGLHELLASALATADRDDAVSRSLIAHAEQTANSIDARRVAVDGPSSRLVLATALGGALAAIGVSLLPGSMTDRKWSADRVEIGSGRAAEEDANTLADSVSSGPPDSAKSTRTSPDRRDTIPDKSDTSATRDGSALSDNLPSQRSDDRGAAAAKTDDAREVGAAMARAHDPGERHVGEDVETSGRSRDGRARSGEAAETATNAEDHPRRDEPGVLGRDALHVSREGESARSATDSHGASEAADALARGRVPSRSRDLVRAYFDLPATAAPSTNASGHDE